MVRMLETHENVMAAELGFAPLLADDILLLTLEMCLGELPLIFSLPVEQVLSLGPRLIQEGAQAISIAAPRGALDPTPNSLSDHVGGEGTHHWQTYGPLYFPARSRLSTRPRNWDFPLSVRAGCGQRKTPRR